MVNTLVPLRVIEDTSFKDLFSFLQIQRLGLTLMSRQTLGIRIHEQFKKNCSWLRDELRDVAWVATTADVWSSSTRSFLGMTIHRIDGNFERRTAP